MRGGSMKGGPFIKSILVDYHFISSIPVQDASNGFGYFPEIF